MKRRSSEEREHEITQERWREDIGVFVSVGASNRISCNGWCHAEVTRFHRLVSKTRGVDVMACTFAAYFVSTGRRHAAVAQGKLLSNVSKLLHRSARQLENVLQR